MIKLNNRKIRISFFSLMTVVFLVVIVSLILISLLPNMKDKNTGSSFNLDLNNEKFKGVYPDIVMINGKIGSVTNDNQKIIIYYKRILQYSSLNYLKIENPIIYIYNGSEKIYYIKSNIAYTENLDNIKKISFQENTTINDLKQNIIIEGDLFKCDIENRVITSDIQSTVKKDGFVINSVGIYIDDNYAIFKNNVDIINDSGFYDHKIVDEFVNFKGRCDLATFYTKDNFIKMEKNAYVKSRMLDIQGDKIQFFQIKENLDNSNNNNSYSNRITVDNGYAQYISKEKKIFYSKGYYIDYRQGDSKLFILKNGNGYYKDSIENSIIYFTGENVIYSEDLKNKSSFKINKGYFHQKKYFENNDKNTISEFYSNGEFINLIKNQNYSYICKNGYGYLKDLEKNNEVVFNGNNIDYKEKGLSKITGNANIYDLIGKTYVKGEELLYFDEKKIVTSEQPFFLRHFNENFSYNIDGILNGQKPDFEKNFVNIKRENYIFLINDIQANKGKMNTEDSSSILEGNVNIIDYENLLQIKSNYASYSGNDDQIYNAEGNLFIYQYESIEKILIKKYLTTIIQSEKGIVYKKDNLAYFDSGPKIKNFKENFYIQSDLLEAHLDTKVYVFKDNIKLLVNTSENKDLENQIYILGQYAVYETEKKTITFSGPSILYQKNIELYVLEIYVDFNNKTINFKGIKDSKIKSIKF